MEFTMHPSDGSFTATMDNFVVDVYKEYGGYNSGKFSFFIEEADGTTHERQRFNTMQLAKAAAIEFVADMMVSS